MIRNWLLAAAFAWPALASAQAAARRTGSVPPAGPTPPPFTPQR